MKIKIDDEEYIDIDEVTKLLGRSKSSIYFDIKVGTLPEPMKLKNVRFWKVKQLNIKPKNVNK